MGGRHRGETRIRAVDRTRTEPVFPRGGGGEGAYGHGHRPDAERWRSLAAAPRDNIGAIRMAALLWADTALAPLEAMRIVADDDRAPSPLARGPNEADRGREGDG